MRFMPAPPRNRVVLVGILTVFASGALYLTVMAASATLRPNGDGTCNNVEDSGGTTCASSMYAEIDDDPDSPTTSDYVVTSGTSAGDMFYLLSSTPSDFQSMDGLTVKADINVSGFSDDTSTLYAQVYQSDESTTLTDEVQVATEASSDGLHSVTFNTVTASDKTTWDGARLRLRWSYTQNSGPDNGEVRATAVELSATYTATDATKQEHFRWRNDDGGESGATWKAAEDSNSIENINKGETVRLRFEVYRSGSAESASKNYRVEWATKSGGSCGDDESWTRVGSSSDDFAMVDSSNLTDGDSTTDQLDTGTGTHVAGELADTSDETGAIGPLSSGEDTEVEYSMEPTENAVDGTTYCFRVTDAGTALDTYNVFPELSTPPPAPMELTQESYIFENDDGSSVDGNTLQTSGNNTAITDVKKGERVTARFHVKNASGVPGETADFGLFYDHGDGIWNKITREHPPDTNSGDCADSTYECTIADGEFTNLGDNNFLAIGPNGDPWVSYMDGENDTLEVAKYVGSGGDCSDAAWDCATVDSSVDAGDFGTSIAFDSSGDAWVSYIDFTNFNLKVAHYVGSGGDCSDAAWDCTTVDSSADVGQYSSIVVDSNGDPWVGYFENTNANLKVAHYVGSGGDCSDAAWDCTTVDSQVSDTGFYTSITLDPDGDPWVAYHDYTNHNLKVANRVGSGGDCSDAAWDCTTVDSQVSDTGRDPSVAFDPAGIPWVSYRDNTNNNLKVANRVGSGGDCSDAAWDCITVDSSGDVGQETGIAFDPAGNPWIAYEHVGNVDLKVARRVGSGGDCSDAAWDCGVVIDTSGTSSGNSASIAFDTAGTAWLSYDDPNNHDLHMAHVVDRSGELTASPGAAGGSGDALTTSRADSSDGGTDCVSASSWTNGVWSDVEEVPHGLDDGECSEVSFVIDTSQAVAGRTYRLVLATEDGWREDKGVWRGPVSVSNYAKLTVMQDTVARYAKDTTASFANCSDTDWGCEILDGTDDVGINSTVAFEHDGKSWVAYEDTTNANLMVAEYVGSGGSGCDGGTSTWNCVTVDPTASGDDIAIAISNTGTPWIVYSGVGGSESLNVAKYVGSGGSGCTSSAWDCNNVDTGSGLGINVDFASIAFSPTGSPWVSYHDASNGNLKVARRVGSGGNCDNTAWECQTVDTTNTSGTYSTIAFDADGDPWVSHYESVNDNLRVSEYVGGSSGDCSNTAWECTLVDATGNMGAYNSMAFDPNDNPLIAYHDIDNENLKIAEYVGSGGNCDATGGSDAWECTNIDDHGAEVGHETSVAFDSSGDAWITHKDEGSGDLRVTRHVGSGGNCDDSGGSDAWQCVTVDATNDVGAYPSLAFDPSGAPWISYYGDTNGDLRIAKLHLPSTQLSADDAIPYDTRSASSGDAQYRLDHGNSPRSNSDGTCSGSTDEGYCGVAHTDGEHDTVTAAAGERPMYTFARKFDTDVVLPSISWVGRSTVAPSSSGITGDIVLQVYRFGSTDSWETVQTDTSSSDCSTSNCVITAQPSGTVSEYYDTDGSQYWSYFRVWQYEDTGSITFKTDSFKAVQTRQWLRHGRYFQGGTSRPFSWPVE